MEDDEVQAVAVTVIPPPKPLSLSKLALSIERRQHKIERQGRELFRELLAQGQELLRAKALCGHGNFENWLEDNCKSVGRTMAAEYMKIARRHHEADESLKKYVAGLKSFRQIRAAMFGLGRPDQKRLPPASEPSARQNRRPKADDQCDYYGCTVRDVVTIRRCSRHIHDILEAWVETASKQQLQDMKRRIQHAEARSDS
jgi:hypothetical protein